MLCSFIIRPFKPHRLPFLFLPVCAWHERGCRLVHWHEWGCLRNSEALCLPVVAQSMWSRPKPPTFPWITSPFTHPLSEHVKACVWCYDATVGALTSCLLSFLCWSDTTVVAVRYCPLRNSYHLPPPCVFDLWASRLSVFLQEWTHVWVTTVSHVSLSHANKSYL